MLLSEFDYPLPEERIAQQPLLERDSSRLLVMDRSSGNVVEHTHFRSLPDLLLPGDLLVINDTKVNALRLRGHRKTGGNAEAFLTHRVGEGLWQALVRPGRRIREGERLIFDQDVTGTVKAVIDEEGGRLLQFDRNGDTGGIDEVLESVGETPLPPYISGSDASDKKIRDRYQTIYARDAGSAAAPTAGLHFSEEVFRRIREAGVEIANVTLHVGIGTFRPIKTDLIDDHKMHSESLFIPTETSTKIENARGRIIAVGTTSVRALESMAIGRRSVKSGSALTDIFISPGYNFQVVDGLVTNFHMPRSTLLVLLAAFAGREAVMNAYRSALDNGYRFLSFGDAMFVA